MGKKYHGSWAMFDWANSAYNLVITSTIFPAYYAAVTTKKENGVVVNDIVDFFGWQVKNTSIYEYILATAYLIIALASPFLSSIADYTGKKKMFMTMFTIVGALCCCGLFFFTEETINSSLVLFGLACIGYCGSLVFYNAYLPEIAMPEDRDRLSAYGYTLGYIGSVILQLVCFALIMIPGLFNDEIFPIRLSFFLVGIWWLGFALIPIFRLPNSKPIVPVIKQNHIVKHSLLELKKVFHQVQAMPKLKWYLLGFFFYSMGVQTVMLAATLFGSNELHLESTQLIVTILIIQIIAILGAYMMANLAQKLGNLSVISITVIIWIGACVAAYFVKTAGQFYILATVVGLVMGGIQSLSRSTYSKLMPPTPDTTSFFSFYDVLEKMSIVFGMLAFGIIDQFFGMRQSILILVLFFIIGLFLIRIANKKRITIYETRTH